MGRRAAGPGRPAGHTDSGMGMYGQRGWTAETGAQCALTPSPLSVVGVGLGAEGKGLPPPHKPSHPLPLPAAVRRQAWTHCPDILGRPLGGRRPGTARVRSTWAPRFPSPPPPHRPASAPHPFGRPAAAPPPTHPPSPPTRQSPPAKKVTHRRQAGAVGDRTLTFPTARGQEEEQPHRWWL